MGSNAVLARDEFQAVPAIELRDIEGFKGVFAKEDIRKDAIIFYLKGTVSRQQTKYTIQLGRNRHLTLPAIGKTSGAPEYSWQYLNHKCEPNGYINTTELTFRALRDIGAGEEITFNYLTTESEMAVPFNCSCGSTNCFGFIQGHKSLNPAQAKRLASVVGEDNLDRKSGGKPAFLEGK